MKFFVRHYQDMVPGDKATSESYEKASDAIKQRFDDLVNYLEKEKPVLKLDSVGLLGPELDLKIQAFESSLQRLKEFKVFSENSNDREEWNKQKSPIRNVVEEVMDHGDTILGSLGEAVIPGAGAIGEVKTVGEKVLKWIRNRRG